AQHHLGVALGTELVPPTAQLVAQLAAEAAPSNQPLSIRPGQYIYYHSTGAHLSMVGDVEGGGLTARIIQSYEYQGWFDPHGMKTQRMRRTDGAQRRPFTPADAEAIRKLKYDLNAPPEVTDDGPAPDQPLPPDCTTCGVARDPGELFHPSPEYLASLPTDPVRLLVTLRTIVGDHNKHSPDQQVFQAIKELFNHADGIIPPDLRAALYRALALIPGVQRAAGQVDMGGQRGIAVGRVGEATEDPTSREDLVFDTTGRRLIGFRTVQVKAARGVPVGTVTWWEVIENTVVDKVGQTG
ncbi:CU044_5270 family protein, partial [Micromonospora zhanjiangensis]